MKILRVADLVLMWDYAHKKKEEHTKFHRLWLVPFHIYVLINENAFKPQRLTNDDLPFPIKGQFLKHYFKG